MKRYKVFKNGVCTNTWYSDFADETYYEPNFGQPGEYELVVEDMTAELAEQERVKREDELNEGIRVAAKKRIMDVDMAKANTLADIKQILIDIRILLSKWK